MIKRQMKRILACVLVLCMAVTLFRIPAYGVTQSEIDALKKQRNEITAQREEKQAVIDQLEAEHAGVLERKLAMDERNMYTLQQIQNISEEIALYAQMIEDKARQVDEARRQEAEQLDRYRSRVRAMEENGDFGFLALLLNTSSLGELLTAIDDIGEIMQSDRELQDDYIAARENTERVKAEYEETKAELDDKQRELKDEQAQLELEIEEAIQLIYQLETDIGQNQETLDELLAAEDEANARIDQLVAELERQRQEALAAQGGGGGSGGGSGGGGGSVSGSGSFMWPAPSTTYCTSRFGLRVHPVYGTERNHTGLDIGAGHGATVLASDGGTVKMASVNGGYGNCIMIDHGNGYTTLYGHLSAYAVSAGQAVSKGDVIGYVGDTGVVTGPHLHFEVLLNGGRIDPEQFFSGLTFSPDAGV